jgi:hypothetical protein
MDRKRANRIVLDGLRVTVEFETGPPALRVWDTADEARRDAAVCAAAFGAYVFDRSPVVPLVRFR